MAAAGRIRWSVEHKILLGFALALLILVLIGFLAYRATSGQLETTAWVTHARSVVVSILDLHSAILEIENGTDGYIVAGQDQYLSTYRMGVERAWNSFGKLDSGISDSSQRRLLQELHPRLQETLAMAQRMIDGRRSSGFETQVALFRSGEGKVRIDRIHDILDAMATLEEDLLAEREGAAKASVVRTHITLAGGVILAFMAVALSGLFIFRDMAERKRAELELRESQNLMQDFLENANDLIHSVDVDGRFLYVNRKWRETLGYREEDLPRLKLLDIVHPDYRERTEAARQKVLDGVTLDNYETVFVSKEGKSIVVSGHINVRREANRPVATRSIFRNITDGKRAEEELQRSNEVLLKSVTELEQRTHEIAKLSEMGDLLQSCQSVEEAYRIIARAVPQIISAEGGTLGIISSSRNLVEVVAWWGQDQQGEQVFAPEDCWALRRGRMNVAEEPDSALRCRHLSDLSQPGQICVPLVAQGEALGLLSLRGSMRGDEGYLRMTPARQRLIGTVADRVALAIANLKLREAMRQQSVRDPLTGLYNRRHMEEALDRELRRAARGSRSLGILMLDLDHFKRFNDSFGHDAGDTLLREFSSMLSSSIRGGDIACRYGGEEFALILPDAGLDVTRQRAELLRDKTKHLSVQHRGLSLGIVTISIGVAAYPDHGKSADVLLRASDAALYAAKVAGRDRVAVAMSHTKPETPSEQA